MLRNLLIYFSGFIELDIFVTNIKLIMTIMKQIWTSYDPFAHTIVYFPIFNIFEKRKSLIIVLI